MTLVKRQQTTECLLLSALDVHKAGEGTAGTVRQKLRVCEAAWDSHRAMTVTQGTRNARESQEVGGGGS